MAMQTAAGCHSHKIHSLVNGHCKYTASTLQHTATHCKYSATHYHHSAAPCYGVATIRRLLKITRLFCRILSLHRALLQKIPIVLRSLLIVATPYTLPHTSKWQSKLQQVGILKTLTR